MSRIKIAVAVLVTAGTLAFAVAPAEAENHWLKGNVPVLSEPELDQNSGDFAFAQADSGEAIAFWGQGDGMYASIRPAVGRFETPARLVSDNGSGTSLPQVAMTPTGAAVAVWRGQVLGKSQVLAATRPAGEPEFGDPVQVSFEPFSVPSVKPQVDVADDGTALIVWRGYDVDGDENSSRVRGRFLDAAGELDGPISNISPVSATGVDFPQVAVGPNGHSLTSWVVGDQFTGDPATLWAGPGGVTPDLQVIDTNTGGIPRAAVDATGLSLIVFKDNTTVVANRRPAGAGQDFLFDQNLNLPATQGFTPFVEMDKTGKATVAFPAFGGGSWKIGTTDRPAGSDTFFGTSFESVSDRDDLENLSLAVGADGTVMQAWKDADGRVYGTLREAGSDAFTPTDGPVSPPIETGAVRAGAAGNGKGILAFSTSTAPAEDFTISARPYDDVPTAKDLSIPATATVGQAVKFSVDTVDPWALMVPVDAPGRFEWTLDPGVVKDGFKVTHTYETAGERIVKVKLTDSDGNTNTYQGSIKVNPKPVPPDKVKPKVTKFRVKAKRAKAKKKNAFLFTLSERARVVIKAKKISKGKGRGKVGKIVKKSKGKGRHKVNFRKKIGKRKLVPGTYRATIVATDKAGNRSKPRRLKFRIIG